ncbi:MAG: ATPase, T2SS/T4P/T4SS family [Candidatus Methanoperedens sp.]|nr:ATPase, T2SS/T4P/T4SS family [Candidatus Methanoperedens sp.]MCZ7369115.1 ATPase, T2SS/T4P/T4SS family [Candidatus Methanoperedens sp.]
MIEIREKVRVFLAKFKSPDEMHIGRFVSDLASVDPSIDTEDLKKRLVKLIKQGEEIEVYEGDIASISPESPIYDNLTEAVKEAKAGHEKMEDVSGQLKIVRKFLKSSKGNGNRKEGKTEGELNKKDMDLDSISRVGKQITSHRREEKEKAFEDLESDEDEKEAPRKKSKKLRNKSKKGLERAAKKNELAVAAEEVNSEREGANSVGEVIVKPSDDGEISEEKITAGPEETIPREDLEKEPVDGKAGEMIPGIDIENIPEQEETAALEDSNKKPNEIEISEKDREKIQVPEETRTGEELEELPLEELILEEEKPEIPPEAGFGLAEKVGQPQEDHGKSDDKEAIAVAESNEVYAGQPPEENSEKASLEELVWSKEKLSPEGVEGFLARLESDDARDIIKQQLTPEKQAVFELLEEKLMSDVETRIKKLKEMQSKVLEENPPQTFLGKVKYFFTKEPDSIESYDPAVDGPLVTFEGLEGFNEIERYWVNEPYAFVVILFNPDNNSYLYYIAEPVLTDFEDLFLKEIKDRLKDVLLVEEIKTESDKDKILTSKVKMLVKDYAIDISPITLEKVMYYTRRDFIKFGKIDPLMHDNRIEDVSANGHDIPIYLYHKKYANIPTNIYYNEKELTSYVIRLAQRCGKHISIAEPMIDATMPDGSRIQMTLGTEVTSHGCTFTIRKFSEIPITPVDLLNWNTFSPEEMAYLWLCIENNKSLIFAGGTASGKTSSLNAVSLFIPAQAKVITLEDTRELKLPHPNWIPGITRDSFTADGRGSIDMYELLRAALRQRPEFLLVGEVRGKEALTLFQAMSTGHTTFSTMHADSVSSAIHRLENPPISVPRTMIQALNIISIQSQTYVKGKRSRRNMKLVEITDIDPTTRNIRTNDIFVWDPLTDKFLRVGESKAVNEIMIRRGWSLPDLKNELMNRQKILEFMVNNKISDFNAISTIIHDYQATPEKIIKKLNITPG